MAKINNSEIIQKLIDELALSPASDLIPTEVADKVLAVFQVNQEAVNMKEEGDLRLIQDNTENEDDKTFTVPTGKKWEVEAGHIRWKADATVGDRGMLLEIQDSAGFYLWITERQTDIAASATGWFNLNKASATPSVDTQTTTFQNIPFPCGVWLPAGATIRISESGGGVSAGDDVYISLIIREADEEEDFQF